MPPQRAQTVVGLGELLWDCFPDRRRAGGAPANVAFHANQFGHAGIVCSRVGADELGTALRQELTQAGMTTDHLQIDLELPTGTVTVDASVADKPRYTIHEPVAWDALEFTPGIARLASGCAVVCFGTLAQRDPRSERTIHRFLDAAEGALKVYDVNLRQDWYTRDRIERSLRQADVVKLNLEELELMAGLFELPGHEPAAWAHALRERSSSSLICLTRAEAGCLLVGIDGLHDEPGRPVDVVDAVGAGDAFTAAMITARLGGWALDATARLANAAGALVASRAGSMPDLRPEFEKLLIDYGSES